MSYPKYTGATDALGVKPGSVVKRVTAEGTSWVLTLNGTQDAFDAYALARGQEPATIAPTWGIPSGYYIDEISERYLLEGPALETGAYEVDLTCRSPENMGDGILTDSIPDVYQCQWQQMDIPLAAHTTRYLYLKTFVGSSNKTVWGYIQDWVNASNVAEQQSAYAAAIAGMTSTQRADFEDYCVMTTRGVESKEVFLPILIRTQITNTAPTSTNTPGQIETPPTGFGAITPTGFTWRRMPDEVTRTGRVGPYNLISKWLGDPSWDTRLYGTLAEQAANYQSLG